MFWVPAISQESFELAYREIGVRLGIPGIADDNADVKTLVQQALSSKDADNWLIIVDNADDYEILLSKTNSGSKPTRLSDYLPRSDRGAILLTTRSRKVAAALTPSSVLRLDDMSKGEARQLLRKRTAEQALYGDERAVDELLESLICLPLAIVQAAAFMSTNDVSVSDYLALFRDTEAQAELFREDFVDSSRYDELDSTIAKTWHISKIYAHLERTLSVFYNQSLPAGAHHRKIPLPSASPHQNPRLLPCSWSLAKEILSFGTKQHISRKAKKVKCRSVLLLLR